MNTKVTLARPEDDVDPYDQTTSSWVNMSIGEDFVSIANQLKLVGTTDTGKTWVRFEDQRVRILKLGEYPDGRARINYYEKVPQREHWNGFGPIVDPPRRNRKRMRVVNITSKLGTRWAPFDQYCAIAAQEFIRMYERRYGSTGLYGTSQDLQRLAYPMLRGNPKWNYVRDLGSALRQVDDRAFVESMFGKTRYRKDLMKAVAVCNSTVALAIARQFRGHIPVDWIIDALRDVPAYHQYRELRDGVATLRKILPLVDQGSARRLLRGALDPDTPDRWILDSYKAIEQIARMESEPERLGKVTGWREVHDQLASQARMSVKKNHPIPQKHKIVKALDGQVFEERIEFRHAKDTDMLEQWGSRMNNCIGTYDNQARNEQTFLFGAYEGGELRGNMEVGRSGRVVQFVGKHNGKYPGDTEEIRKWIHELTGYQDEIRVEHGGQAYVINPNALANPYAPNAFELNQAVAGNYFDANPIRHMNWGNFAPGAIPIEGF